MATIKDLHSFEKNSLVGEVLDAYLGTAPNRVCHSLVEDCLDETEYWANENGMSVEDFVDWVDASLRYPAKFKVVKEAGSGGGWPECILDLDGGVIINMDWVTDD